jgi:hypothetical protein
MQKPILTLGLAFCHTAAMDLRELSISRAGNVGRHPWEQARVDAVEHILRRNGAAQPGSEGILDFGCGDAFLANSLTERFASSRVSAVDKAFTPEVRTRIEPALGERVRLFDSMESAESAGLSASLVLLLDVLEHCEKDVETLERVVESRAVKPGALFLLTVPAFQGLFSRHDEFLGHYRRYSLGELADVARQAGLTVRDQSYFFSTLLLPRSVKVILEKLGVGQAKPKGLGDYQAKPFLDPLVRRVLWVDFRFCKMLSRTGLYVPGLSCFVLAQKTDSKN